MANLVSKHFLLIDRKTDIFAWMEEAKVSLSTLGLDSVQLSRDVEHEVVTLEHNSLSPEVL
jgi:hypothetical protein